MNNYRVALGIVEKILKDNEYRSDEIITGIDGERFHVHDMHKIVMMLTDGQPSETLQISAIFHDIDRVITPRAGAGFRGERYGIEYENYKKLHAKRSASITSKELQKKKIDKKIINRAEFLIKHHDDTMDEIKKINDEELDILVASDSLSWLNFSAPNFFNGKDPRGVSGLIDKMRFMLEKLPKKYWKYLPKIELIEPKVLPYLKIESQKIARQIGVEPPNFKKDV